MHVLPETRPSLLLRICDAQDAQAWAEFVELYEPVIYRTARRRGLQHADACELSQDVLCRVASAIPRWQPDRERGSFRGWLLQIARNAIVNALVKQQRHPRASGNTDVQRMLEEQPERVDESRTFELERRRQLFRRAADLLRREFQPSTWAAFWETCVEMKSIKAVAADLGISVGAVYVARSRVMSRLRAVVQELEGD